MESWSEYIQLSKNTKPAHLLESAIKLAPSRNHALDLGAGSLKDSKFLLSMGFKQVTAIEKDPSAKQLTAKIPASVLKLQIKSFEDIKTLPKDKFDIINASYSLPFVTPPHLPKLVELISKSLAPDGLFCGQFFGPDDSWNKPENHMSFIDKKTLLKLLAPLELIHLQEKQFDGKTLDGEAKHWHLFDVIAQKAVAGKNKRKRV